MTQIPYPLFMCMKNKLLLLRGWGLDLTHLGVAVIQKSAGGGLNMLDTPLAHLLLHTVLV